MISVWQFCGETVNLGAHLGIDEPIIVRWGEFQRVAPAGWGILTVVNVSALLFRFGCNSPFPLNRHILCGDRFVSRTDF